MFSVKTLSIGGKTGGEGHILEYPDDSRFGFVKDQIIDLVIAMNQGRSVSRLGGWIAEERYHLIKMGDPSDRNICLDVNDLRLRSGNSA